MWCAVLTGAERVQLPLWVPAQEAAQIETAWSNFARSGDPNGPAPLPTQPGRAGPFTMPKFEAGRPAGPIANFSVPSGTKTDFRGDKCPYFDSIGYNRG